MPVLEVGPGGSDCVPKSFAGGEVVGLDSDALAVAVAEFQDRDLAVTGDVLRQIVGAPFTLDPAALRVRVS